MATNKDQATIREFIKLLEEITRVATNVTVEITKFFGVNCSEEIVAFANRLLSNGDLHALLHSFTGILSSVSQDIQQHILELVQKLRSALLRAMFVFPVNDGIMECLYFVKKSEYDYVRKAWEELETWPSTMAEAVVKWEDESVDRAVLSIENEICDAVKVARRV